MKKMISAFLLMTMLFVLTFVTACGEGGGAGRAPAAAGGDGLGYRFTWTADATTLNPHATVSLATADLHAWTNSGLFRRVPTPDRNNSHIIPDIASGPPVSVDADGLVWHIPLRPYAVFHNGTPITAHTFEQSFRWLLSPRLVNLMANFLYGGAGSIVIQNGRQYFTQDPPTAWEDVGIRAVDDHTLEIITTRPFRQDQVMSHFLDRSTMPVYIELYAAGMNADGTETTYGTTLDNFMSAGPFFYDTWVVDAEHIFIRNPDHWLAEHFHFDRVSIRIVPDAGARMLLFEAGEIDLVPIELAQFVQFQDDPRIRFLTGVMPTHIDINNLNEDQPILQTLDFRRALQWGIDRASISILTNMPAQPTYIGPEAGTFMGDGTPFRNTPQGQLNWPPNYGFDPVRSRAYFDAALAEAGVDFVSLRWLYSDANAAHRVAGEFLEQHLPQIWGADRFELILQSAPSATVGSQRNWRETVDFDITITAWATAAQRLFPHQAFTHMISPASRPNPFLPDTFLEAWHRAQELTAEIPLNYTALLDAAAELEAIWMYYVINVPVWQGVTFNLVSERIETGMNHFMPAIGFGMMFGREAAR